MLKMRSLSVSEVNQYIKRILTTDPLLRQVIVEGEISNLTKHSSGHLYFSLKDDTGKLSCVMFANQAQLLKFDIENGDKVSARGQITIYEREGRYQLYVQDVEKKGLGELHVAFEKLKKELYELGYFDSSKKLSLPSYPKSIGIITSPTGAAIRDIISVYKRRSPLSELKIYPVRVQGAFSKDEIVSGIEYFNKVKNVDLIILSRGGGSIEELWSFNERIVADAVYTSKIPVLTGIGHEVDFTIVDFVADRRAATPSAAAEIAITSKDEIAGELNYLLMHMKKAMTLKITNTGLALEKSNPNRMNQLICQRFDNRRQILAHEKLRLLHLAEQKLNQKIEALDIERNRLNVLSPLGTLARGYAVVKKNNQTITSISEVSSGDAIEVVIKDGVITTKVMATLAEKKI